MDDQTTTDAPVTDSGVAATTQPETDVFGESAATSPEQPTTTEPTTDKTEGADAAQPVDENLEWISKSKGIDPSTPDGQAKLAKMYRDAERALHEAKQPKLNEALTDQPAIEQPTEGEMLASDPRIDQLILERNVERFLSGDGNAELAAERKALEPLMAAKVQENPALGQLVRAGYMSYDDLAALAKGSNPEFGQQLKAEGSREALQEVATRQQARAVPGVATTSAVAGEDKPDAFIAGFDSVK